MKLCVIGKITILDSLISSKHRKTTRPKVHFAKISPKPVCALTVISVNSRMGLINWDVTQISTFLTRQSIAIRFWTKSAAFMDLGATLSIKASQQWTKRPNGPKYTATIDRLFGKFDAMVKADWLPYWNPPLPDIYIILFSSIKTQLSLTKCLKMSSAKQ